MGLIDRVFGLLFGTGGNVIRDTAEVFVENAEQGAIRAAKHRGQALAQFGAEFGLPQRGLFDRLMDGLNRVPRPALALGTLGLFVAAMVDPIWFAARMQGMALVPEPLWWLLGAIVSFYFGARHQMKHQQFQTQIAAGLARTPQVLRNLSDLDALRRVPEELSESDNAGQSSARGDADPTTQLYPNNAALQDWSRLRGS